MWRNTAVLDFVGWLREHNDEQRRDDRAKARFYGLDLYSLYRSIHEVVSYLDRVDEQNAQTVQSAEAYYRAMFSGRVSPWNLRDRHVIETLDALAGRLGRQRGNPREDRRVGAQLPPG
jgi:erythromycin esterase-like protein